LHAVGWAVIVLLSNKWQEAIREMVHDAQAAMRKRRNKRRRKGQTQLPRMTQLPDVIQVHLLSHLDTDASVFYSSVSRCASRSMGASTVVVIPYWLALSPSMLV
jgi:hypothetical protein